MLKSELFKFSVYDNLVDRHKRNEIKLGIQRLNPKLVLFYTVHQLHCQSGMTPNKHVYVLG